MQSCLGIGWGSGSFTFRFLRDALAFLFVLVAGMVTISFDAAAAEEERLGDETGERGAEEPTVTIEGDTACPTRVQVAKALVPLLRRTRVVEHGQERTSSATLMGTGDELLVRIHQQERNFDFSGTSCGSRARSVAVFIALILEPPSFLESSPPPSQPAPPSVEVDERESRVFEAAPAVLRFETSPLVHIAPSSGTTNTPVALGWDARVVWGERLGLSAGVAGFLPYDYRYDSGVVRVTRVRIDAALRGSLDVGVTTFFLELGPELAWTSSWGKQVLNPRNEQRLEVTAKTRAGARWNVTRSMGLFTALHAALDPRPSNYQLNPDQDVGSAPSLWLGAELGLSFVIAPAASVRDSRPRSSRGW